MKSYGVESDGDAYGVQLQRLDAKVGGSNVDNDLEEALSRTTKLLIGMNGIQISSIRMINMKSLNSLVQNVKHLAGAELRELSIIGAEDEPGSFSSLIDFICGNSCKFPNVEFLRLEDVTWKDSAAVGLDDKDLLGLTAAKRPLNLRFLSLKNAQLNSKTCQALAGVIREMKLEHVILSGNIGVQERIHEIMDALSNSPGLTHLEVASCAMHSDGAMSLADTVMDCTEMAFLNVSNCQLGHAGVSPLARVVIAHPNLTTLDLSNNNIGHAGALHLANALRGNRILRRLDVSRNELGEQGAVSLAEGLEENFGLQELIVDGNEFTDAPALKLAKALSRQKSLQVFSCRDETMSLQGHSKVALELRTVPLEFLFLGRPDAVFNIVTNVAFQEFLSEPLTYAVRHKWLWLVEVLIDVRNTYAEKYIKQQEDEFRSDDLKHANELELRIDDADAAGSLNLLLRLKDGIYEPARRLELAKRMLGDDGCRGLTLRNVRNLKCRLTALSRAINVPSMQVLEDFWCCGGIMLIEVCLYADVNNVMYFYLTWYIIYSLSAPRQLPRSFGGAREWMGSRRRPYL